MRKKWGLEWGKAGPKDGVFAPVPYGFVLPHPHLLGSKKILPYLVKLYFLLICSTTIIIFFNKTCFLNQNILEIKLNLSH